MSPYPAGHAKKAGRILRASETRKVKPSSLKVWNSVIEAGLSDSKYSRKLAEDANHTAKITSGITAADAMATPKGSDALRNRLFAEPSDANRNHAPMSGTISFP